MRRLQVVAAEPQVLMLAYVAPFVSCDVLVLLPALLAIIDVADALDAVDALLDVLLDDLMPGRIARRCLGRSTRRGLGV